jgi:aspartyl/asparaginyl-tRNA synthetase
MRRRIRKKAPVPQTPVPVTEPEMVEKEIMPFVLRHEDEIISYIRDKAVKETMKSLAPLLEKLEEAVKQQESAQTQIATQPPPETPVMNYEEQLKKLQEASSAKVKEKELKIMDRMNKLNARFGNIRP